MVAVPWPSPCQAARWNGQAPQTATGPASSRLTHCQPGNCAAGTMAMTITATASGPHTASRRPSAAARPGSRPGSGPPGRHGGVAGGLDDA